EVELTSGQSVSDENFGRCVEQQPRSVFEFDGAELSNGADISLTRFLEPVDVKPDARRSQERRRRSRNDPPAARQFAEGRWPAGLATAVKRAQAVELEAGGGGTDIGALVLSARFAPAIELGLLLRGQRAVFAQDDPAESLEIRFVVFSPLVVCAHFVF